MKAMKKALALGLALAMVVTAVPVTNAQAATTGLPKNKTYAAGKSYTLKLTTPSSWKSVKTTWSEKDSEISLSSKKAKSVKVKAIKKGSAKVTAKVTFKKASKKYTKTYKCKVTVKNPSLTAADAATVAVGSTVNVKAAKAWPTTAKVTYKSDKTDVATVDATTGEVTGVAAGEATITTTLVCGTKTLTATTKVTVKTAIIEMTSLDVKAADTLVAKFAYPVKKDNTTLTLKRGTTSVAFKETWNADGTEVTVKTDAKMTTGTYELTATDKTDATITSSKTATVEAQKATEIVILNDAALTGEKIGGAAGNSLEAYVYYDVLDQYGESMRSSVSIEWSSSVKVTNKNVASGMLTLERTDSKDFTYGEQIFITGVNTKTGLSVNKTLTVGAKQAVNSVVMAGFIKKGTTDILTALPKDFKDSAYYMLYNVVDQNGNDMKTGRFDAGDTIEDITFVSDSPLVIKEMTKAGAVVTINDHEYDTVLVSPGIKVEQGGEVNVTAIANKTGNKTVLNVPVNVSEVLKSFVIGTPSDIVADSESVVLPFTATDSNGNNVTNFEIIAKQATFNKLQLTVSTGNLKLSQNDDGTAKLVFSDSAAPAWSDSQTTDGQDRVVSLTAIVVGGETNNQMLNIVDKARPTGVSGVDFKNAYVEGDTATIELTNSKTGKAFISYVDQYGRPMDADDALAFFTASAAGDLKGTDFDGYTFGTMVTYTGNGNSTLTGAANLVSVDNKDVFLTSASKTVVVTMGNKVLSTASGEGCKFAVTKFKTGDGYTSLDRAKNYGYSVVDITKVQGLTVKDTGKIYAQTFNSAKDYLEKTGSVTSGAIMVATIPATHKSSVIVEGTYAGKAVSIPNEYYSYTGKFLSGAGNAIDTASNLTCEDLYNFKATTDNYARKDAEDLLTVTVNEIFSNGKDGAVGADITKKYSDLKKTVLISDAAPVGTTLTANAESTVLHPGKTPAVGTEIRVNSTTTLNDADVTALFTLLDQYGKSFAGLTYEVKDVTEAAAYADNNFAVAGNATGSVTISGAERTDTFTVVASYKKLNASIKVTVGADDYAYIDTTGNNYLDNLVKNYLEPQRQAGLQ